MIKVSFMTMYSSRSKWSHIWLLRFNIAKFKLMRIGNSAPFSYSMISVPTVAQFKKSLDDLWATTIRYGLSQRPMA